MLHFLRELFKPTSSAEYHTPLHRLPSDEDEARRIARYQRFVKYHAKKIHIVEGIPSIDRPSIDHTLYRLTVRGKENPSHLYPS